MACCSHAIPFTRLLYSDGVVMYARQPFRTVRFHLACRPRSLRLISYRDPSALRTLHHTYGAARRLGVFSTCALARRLHRAAFLGQDSSYEYDPKTNSFRQKVHGGSPQTSERARDPGSGKPGWRGFVLRFFKTLFIITGGITWGTIIFLAFFVDRIEVEDGESDIGDGEEAKLRLLAFYDVLRAKKDVLSLLVKGRRSDVEREMSKKEEAFLAVWEKLRVEESIVHALGKPVQLVGYRAAEKLTLALLRLSETTQNVERSPSDAPGDDALRSNSWAPVCIIEGANSTAVLSMLFERESSDSPWILVQIRLEALRNSGEMLCNLTGALPNGLKNYTRFSH